MTKRWLVCVAAAVSLVLSACAEDFATDDESSDDPATDEAQYDPDADDLIDIEELDGDLLIQEIPGAPGGDPGLLQPQPVHPSNTKVHRYQGPLLPVLVHDTPV